MTTKHDTTRVFVIEPVRAQLDISTAEEFGEVIYVFEHDMRRCSVFRHEEFGKAVLRRLQELKFSPDIDCICIVGTMITVVVALIAISQTYDTFNVLLFNATDGTYVHRCFELKSWEVGK